MIQEGKFSDFYQKARDTVLKKKKEKKPSMDSTTKKLHDWRKKKDKDEKRKYVNDIFRNTSTIINNLFSVINKRFFKYF